MEMKNILILLLFPIICSAQKQVGKEVLYNFTQGSFNYNYLVYYPVGYNNSTISYPVCVFLYGLGHDPNGSDTSMFSQGISDQIEHNGFSPNFIVISMQTPLYNTNQKNGWDYSMHPYHIDDVLDHVLPTIRADKNKLYITGLSAGAAAIFAHSASINYTPRYKFAAVAPMSTAGDSLLDYTKIIANNLYGWAFGSDPGDGPHGVITHGIVRNVNALKPNFWLWTNIANGTVGHCCWDREYNQTVGLYDWLLTKSLSSVIDTIPVSSWIYPVKRSDGSISLTAYSIKAGDTVAISANNSPYTSITWTGFKGDSLRKVVILGIDGKPLLTDGFNFVGVTGVKIENFTVNSPTKNGAAISISGRSANIEIANTDLGFKSFGIWFKEEIPDANCQDSLRYPAWWMHDLYAHDNYIHDMSLEGMYVYSTAPNGTYTAPRGDYLCNGIIDSAMPLRGYNVRIVNNKFRRTGRAAIQVSAAEFGTNEIIYNDIDTTGSDPDGYQGNGISVGSYFHGKIQYNKIRHTKKDAIQATSTFADIEYNDIDYAGDNGLGQTSIAGAIYIVSQKSNHPTFGLFDTTSFKVKYNNFGTHHSSQYGMFVETGLGFYSKFGSEIVGNTGTYYVRTGINYTTDSAVTQDSSIRQYAIDIPTKKITIYYNNNIIKTYSNISRIVAILKSDYIVYKIVFLDKSSIVIGKSK